MSRISRALRPGLVVVAAVVVAACGDVPTSVEPHPPDISVPWQAEPFPVDAALAQEAIQLCRLHVIPVEDPTPLAIVDARGVSVLQIVFADANSHYDCRVRREKGAFVLTGGSNGGGSDGGAPGVVAPNVALVGSVHPVDEFHVDPAAARASIVTGLVGAGVADVDVILQSGTRIRASTANGAFVAWWPGDETSLRIQALGPGGLPLGDPHD